MKLVSLVKRAAKSLVRRLRRGKKKKGYDAGGYQAYDPTAQENAGYQSYFQQNEEAIRLGDVPERYKLIAKATPGKTVLELGSADGTQSLVLALEKEAVCGVELMDMQHQTSLELKKEWLDRGLELNRCDFVLGGIDEFKQKLDDYDTVLMSRVLYHLRGDIDDVIAAISKSNVSAVVLVGCPDRSRRFREGGQRGDAMGNYAYYASTGGMEEILKIYGFSIAHSTSDEGPLDPIVVGKILPANGQASSLR